MSDSGTLTLKITARSNLTQAWACEFSLSYGGGKNMECHGQYSKTFPDIYYENETLGYLPTLNMTIVDVLQLGQRLDTHAVGDKISTKSSSLNFTELELDTNGFYA
ncbi:hypothetical protein BGZ76_005901, partial [Entomortierella beljakovae]